MGKFGQSKKGKAPVTVLKTITAKGTQERLSAADLWVKQATIQALASNVGNAIVGGSNADVATGLGTILAPLNSITLQMVNLKEWWGDAENGEGFAITYEPVLTVSS